MIRVLHVHGGMERAGTEAVIMNWYRNIDINKISFDFTTFTKRECSHDKEIKQRGGSLIYVPSRSEVGNLKHIYYLYRAIKDNGPYDVVHSHMNFHGGIVALVAKFAGVKKVICHAHNTSDEYLTLKRKVEQSLLVILIHLFANRKVACSIEAGRYIFKNDNFSLIKNAIDETEFYPADDELQKKLYDFKLKNNLENKLIIGHIGRFSIQKNHKFILNLAEDLYKNHQEFLIILIGSGPLESEIKELITAKNLNSHIMLLGSQTNINFWLNLMDIFIFPSLYEGLGVVLIEAQATGVPCIVSDTIPRAVDLGLELITFLDITNGTQTWIDKIIERPQKNSNIKYIQKALQDKKYSIRGNIEYLMELYNK